MNVLLISANRLIEPYPVYPLGLDYVVGAIQEAHAVEVLDMNTLDEEGQLGDAIRRANPDVIGIALRNVDNTDSSDPFHCLFPVVDSLTKGYQPANSEGASSIS